MNESAPNGSDSNGSASDDAASYGSAAYGPTSYDPAPSAGHVRILVIDNYDSFVYTLVGYLRELGAETKVLRNDALSLQETLDLAAQYDGVLISPGPGTPADAGVSVDLIRWCETAQQPMLGVCLGHQGLGEAFGAQVRHAEELMHGKTSAVVHTGHESYRGIPESFTATRYHSLVVDPGSVPSVLEVTSRSDDGVIMGLAHRSAPLWSMQYHPESVLTEGGYRMLGNWLESMGLQGAADRAAQLNPIHPSSHAA